MSKGYCSAKIRLVISLKEDMKKKLLRYYNPLLRKKSKEVKCNQEAKELIKEMKEILRERDGIGLAAPQIGELKRVIVIDFEGDIFSFINPKITQEGEEKIKTKEGCLSLKGVWAEVERSKKIEVEALNQENEPISLEVEGLMAVVFQHEIDHLDGKLFIDRIGFIGKIKALFSYFIKKQNASS